MNPQKPEYLRPALIAGAVAGLLSGLPFIVGKCFCCLWIVGGAALAANLLAKNTPGILTSGDGAIVGALTGIVAAVVDTLLSILMRPFNMELARRIVDKASDFGYDMPSSLDGVLGRDAGVLAPGLMLLGLFLSAAVFTLMGILGGIIGVSLFGRKPGRAVPPAAPPTPSSGPGDAA